jgi:hypothetical protein
MYLIYNYNIISLKIFNLKKKNFYLKYKKKVHQII